LRQALTANLEAGIKFGAPLFHGLLAEIEFRAHEADRALALIEKGLDIAEETGEHFTDAYLHRLRGDVLLQRDPTNPAPAEDALGPPSPSRSSRARGPSSSSPRSPSPSSINRPAAPPTRTPSSRPPSKAFRRRRKCRRSPRLKRCSRRWRETARDSGPPRVGPCIRRRCRAWPRSARGREPLPQNAVRAENGSRFAAPAARRSGLSLRLAPGILLLANVIPGRVVLELVDHAAAGHSLFASICRDGRVHRHRGREDQGRGAAG